MHLEGQKHLVYFASTPISFSDAWNMKAEELTPEDVVSLSKAGGHFQFNQISMARTSLVQRCTRNALREGA